MGSLELAVGDLASAGSHLRRALASDPQSERAHERLGLVALGLGRPREALEEFERERRLHGSFPRQWLAEARARRAMGDLDGARAAYQRQIDEDPGDAEARDSLQALGGR
jgi:tetratricopeptide (TPR) repeat protein